MDGLAPTLSTPVAPHTYGVGDRDGHGARDRTANHQARYAIAARNVFERYGLRVPRDEEAPSSTLAEPASTPPLEAATGAVRFRKLLRFIGIQAAGGVIVGVLTATAVFVATTHVDNSRSAREAEQSREFAWRHSLTVGADYAGVDLSDLNLSAVYAPSVDLSGGNLSGSDFTNADLTSAQLDGVDLSLASLHDADLVGASIRGAILREADLSNSSLMRTDFRHSDLEGADLSDADVWKTDVRGVDLSQATLPTHGMDRSCWDDSTNFPAGFERPLTSVCEPPRPISGGGMAEQWTIDLLVALKPEGDTRESWTDTLDVAAGSSHVRLLVRFDNLGRAPVQDVSIVIDLGTDTRDPVSVVPDSVIIRNANTDDAGYAFPNTAVQAAGAHIEVGAGTYVGESNFYVTADLALDWSDPRFICGANQFRIVAYASPEGRGAVNDSAAITLHSPELCPIAETFPPATSN